MQNSLDAQEVEQTTRPRSDDSFREVFVTHRLGLFRLAVLLVGDVHAAEEITAEVCSPADLPMSARHGH